MFANLNVRCDSNVLVDRLLYRFFQFDVEFAASHAKHVEGRVPRLRIEVRPGAATELEDLEVLVDDDSRRAVQLEDSAIRKALKIQRRPRRARRSFGQLPLGKRTELRVRGRGSRCRDL